MNKNLIDYLQKYGSHTIAFSSVYDDKMNEYFLPDIGYVMYGKYKNIRFMLGDPLCADENMDTLLNSFIDDTASNNDLLVGMQCSQKTAEYFTKHGYSANHFGVETILFLETFNTAGKAKSKVRRWLNSAKKGGLEVKECDAKDPVMHREIDRISKEWLQKKSNQKELTLLTRPFKKEYEPGVRFFCGFLGEKIVGVNTFEPMYKENEIIGYYANICRIDDDAPNGTLDLIQETARGFFKEEGCKYYSFGLSPLSDIDDKGKLHNPIVTTLLNANYKYGNSLYSFQGLDFHKKSYHDGISSDRVPKYLLTKGTLPINQIINTLGYIGILPTSSFISNLSYLGETMIKGFYETNKVKLGISEDDFNNIIPNLLKGLSYSEISESLHLNSLIIEDFAKSLTNIGKQKLPEFQENMYIQRNLNDVSKHIFAVIEDIVDRDPDALFVYNIGISTIPDGHYVMMSIEVNGRKTINKANFITSRIKAQIKKKCPNILASFIETEPAGQYAYKIGLDNVEEKVITL
ncbi:MAG: DUF2156 domain-containing protein [bacterium]|nr:DUF2156 domain-containing protein [bacterium]